MEKISISQARRITGNILIAAVAVFALYLSAVMLFRIYTVVQKEEYILMLINELAVCDILFLFAADVRSGFFTRSSKKILKCTGWVVRIVVTVFVCMVVFLFGRIFAGALISSEVPADNAIVLGMALEDGKPSDDLLSRIDTAQRYLDGNPGAHLILSGGNPDECGRTEADIMHDLLVGMGVPEDRMIMEERSVNTKDNLHNAAHMIDMNSPVVLITSDYHMDRAVREAVKSGFTAVNPMPAPSSPLLIPANIMWEVVSEFGAMLA